MPTLSAQLLTWSLRTLCRNIDSQYYYRLIKSQDKNGVNEEMVALTSQYQNKLEFIKNPVIAEFLGMQENISFYESDLEQCIIDNLQKFLMELGKGYAFVSTHGITCLEFLYLNQRGRSQFGFFLFSC